MVLGSSFPSSTKNNTKNLSELVYLRQTLDPRMCIITVGHDVRKQVFGLSNKLRFKPVCLATETSLNVEILRVANGVIIQSVFVKHSTT